MSKILLAVNEEDIEVLAIGVSIMKAKQDAQEFIKQAKLELIDEILKYRIGGIADYAGMVEVDDILAIKSEIEKELME